MTDTTPKLSKETLQVIELLKEKKSKDNQDGFPPISVLIQLLINDYQQYWHPDDPAWMRERKKLWKPVLQNIRKLSNADFDLKKAEFALLKTFFFTGHLIYKETSSTPIITNVFFFYFWFLPEEPTIEIMQPLFDSGLGRRAYPVGWFQVDNSKFPPPYGLMGGREKRFIDVFYPKVDWSDTIKLSSLAFRPDGFHMEKEVSGAVNPKRLFQALSNTKHIMVMPEKYNPYAFGRYLWDRFDYYYEHKNDDLYRTIYSERDAASIIPGIEGVTHHYLVIGTLNFIIGFYEHEDTAKDSSIAIEIRTELYERFENKDFSPRLQKAWDDIKRSREITKPSKTFDWNTYSGSGPIKL